MVRREHLSIEIAIAASLVLHALTFGVYQHREALARWWVFQPLAKKFVKAPVVMPVKPAPVPVIRFVEEPAPAPTVAAEPPKPHIFIETDERQATSEQPGPTRFYSDRATVAANEENPTGKLGETPYLAGREDRLWSTESVPVPRPATPFIPPLAPAEGGRDAATKPGADAVETARREARPTGEKREAASRGMQVVEEQRAEAAQKQENVRQMARLGPVNPPPPSVATPAVRSPSGRELVSSRSRLVAVGVSRQGVAAFNVAASPFGAYDKRLIAAVQSRWLALIDRYNLYERAGTVTVSFELYEDGQVGNLRRAENTAGEMLALICEKAVTDSAPFEPLPEQLRLLVAGEPRAVNFTFYY
jgi:hypothetical protein